METQTGPLGIHCIVAASLALLVATAALAENNRTVEFLYIEANSGGSSGGHVALCFNDSCFHFQQSSDGLLRLQRHAPELFDHAYRGRENRPIHVATLPFDGAASAALEAQLVAYELAQTRQIEVRDQLRREAEFLQSLAAGRDARFPLASAGYFFADDDPSNRGALAATDTPSAGTINVAMRLRQAFGPNALALRRQLLQSQIETLEAVDEPPPPPRLAHMPSGWIGMEGRYRELLSGIAAIDVMLEQLPLLDNIQRQLKASGGTLTPEELRKLALYADELEAAAVRLFGSRRPDWGQPLLIALARLSAVHLSLATQRLHLLDVYPQQAKRLAADELHRYRRPLRALATELHDEFVTSRKTFFSASTPRGANENSWSILEANGNRFSELQQALLQATDSRLHSGIPLPLREGWRNHWPLPRVSRDVAAQAAVAARSQSLAYDAALLELYRYDVFQRNCATELLRHLESASVGDQAPMIASEATWTFIPFVSFDTMRAAYPTAVISQRASLRELRLARMARDEVNLSRWLRESNTLTATIYEANPDDNTFLFFPPDTVALRPLLGLANLVTASAASLRGIVLSPFDQGAALVAGANGMLFSLPELGFLNLRKGSFPFATRRDLRELTNATPAAVPTID